MDPSIQRVSSIPSGAAATSTVLKKLSAIRRLSEASVQSDEEKPGIYMCDIVKFATPKPRVRFGLERVARMVKTRDMDSFIVP